MPPRLLPCGDSALTIEIGETIDAECNARIIALAAEVEAAVRAGALEGVQDIVPTYRSLLVCYDPERIRGAELWPRLLALAGQPRETAQARRLWRVPCLYGGEVGQDLEEMARMKGLAPDELVALHSGVDYRVYMIGFAPGFAYLGGQPEILHTPRLPKPRQNIPRGAIGIGGQQGNINSVAGPSGWRFLGWTPVRSFDASRPEPFLFRAGDHVRFHPIDAEEARVLEARSAAGKMIVTPEEIGL
ncbi:MAG: 5-oxoprolinase subunit PxpB [Cereibacter changlensis]